MPSHRLHEEAGRVMGLRAEAVDAANRMIDFPEEFPSLQQLGIGHDDDRLFAMDAIRGLLSQSYGYEGVLAADLHYALDYIDRWLDPSEVKKMLSTMRDELLYPRGRRGFVDPVRRLWYESSRYGTLPITSYCMKCRGISKPVNSPFCNECYVGMFELKEISEMPKQFLSSMLRKKMDERRLDPQVRGFVEKNLPTLIDWVVEDRRARGLCSLTIV
jgi:hypothetical protein